MRDEIYHFPMTIGRIATAERATPPDNARDAYTFQVEASNLLIDAYYTHMTRRTLQQFANDAKAGVQFLDSHNSMSLGYGRTYGGQVRIDRERAIELSAPDGAELAFTPPAQYAYALLDVYTVPGINFRGGVTYASTDDFIRAVDSGLVNDVSVGFYGGSWRCDICGGDYRNYQACQHFAGRVYAAGDNGGRQVLATVAVDGARLAEVSAVYDGATPNATILKARAMAEDGELDTETKRFVEVRYHVDLPTRQWRGVTVAGGIWPNPPETYRISGDEIMDYEQMIEDIRALIDAPDDSNPTEAIRALVAENDRLTAELDRLRPLADQGRAWRESLIAEALGEGVRAHGDGFRQETYRALLEGSSIEQIQALRDDWRGIGNERFPGGRQSVDNEERPQQAQPRRVVAREAHQVR